MIKNEKMLSDLQKTEVIKQTIFLSNESEFYGFLNIFRVNYKKKTRRNREKQCKKKKNSQKTRSLIFTFSVYSLSSFSYSYHVYEHCVTIPCKNFELNFKINLAKKYSKSIK